MVFMYVDKLHVYQLYNKLYCSLSAILRFYIIYLITLFNLYLLIFVPYFLLKAIYVYLSIMVFCLKQMYMYLYTVSLSHDKTNRFDKRAVLFVTSGDDHHHGGSQVPRPP